MAVLNSWQKITRVSAGKVFGDGSDGDYSSSSAPSVTYRSCSGSSGSTTLTLGSSGFSNGDLILIHQTRGSGAGQWEVNKIVSGGNTSSLTLQQPLQYTYSDGGANQAQAVKIFQYNDCTVTGTWNVSAWNKDVGGILAIAVRNVFSGASGAVNLNGADGNYTLGAHPGFGGSSGGAGVGFHGGRGGCSNPAFTSERGEGINGDVTQSQSASANAGGGASKDDQTTSGGGGGGGNGTGGGSGGVVNANATGGAGAGTAGSEDLTTIVFGGGGGGGVRNAVNPIGAGGGGGGILIVFAKNVNLSSLSINANGGNGGGVSLDFAGGGGGGGGSVLVVCREAVLGTNKITANGGSGGGSAQPSYGGNGGSGRIAIHYSNSVSGSTTPSFYSQFDASLVELAGGGAFLLNAL